MVRFVGCKPRSKNANTQRRTTSTESHVMHTRKQILTLLKQKRWTSPELAEHFQCSLQAITYHMRSLSQLSQVKRQMVKREKGKRVSEWWID